ncbi:M20/M25/M40 family metallo-hydrolase [Allosphingosinicella deserti]|uniref:Twin-arginine translocation pathway signal protein n=1 Tax=Allosphingosinicella deserti TaxID=2116704 RepID=A0A2P7QH35_9SPHN|nr:M20/M25/M40 family metallo-hydrolase [Sphingomonas deserti]PSJ37298.1 twin-arginine translocation pathway signal protein [Sphingomonas deserti]
MDRNDFGTSRRALLQAAAAGAAAMMPGVAFAARAGDLAAIRRAAEQGRDAAIARIQAWIRNPTIAAEKSRIDEGVAAMSALAREAGFQTVRTVPTGGVPAVFATLDVGAPKWMGIYFMYDVKQFDPAEWSVPPLEARIVDRPGVGKVIMGRGAVNQKGPQGAFLAALHAFKTSGRTPPVNIALIAEGEEEIASPNFLNAIRDPQVTATMKKCVGVIIPTAGQSANGNATISLGAKGAVEMEIVSSSKSWGRGPAHDIHSSQFARVDSPAWRLVQALNTLIGPDGHTPAVEGFFDRVTPLTARQKALIAEAARKSNEADAKKALGVQRWINDESWEQSLIRLAEQPTINIQGLVGGYTGPGGKTILPHRATAKVEMRLVPDMTKDDSVAKLKAHLAKHGFPDVEVNVTGGYGPNQTPEDAALTKAQQAVLTRAGITWALNVRNAGSWPGVVFTGDPLRLPAGQFGLGTGAGAHAPDEYFVIESINPKIAGLTEQTMAYADLLYEVAAQG